MSHSKELVSVMSTEQDTKSCTPAVGVTKHARAHPLSPLTALEITKSADLIRGLYPSRINLQFKAITLEEPIKAELAPFLEAEHLGATTPNIDRKAFVNYYLRNTVCPLDLQTNLTLFGTVTAIYTIK